MLLRVLLLQLDTFAAQLLLPEVVVLAAGAVTVFLHDTSAAARSASLLSSSLFYVRPFVVVSPPALVL